MAAVTQIPRDPVFLGELVGHFRDHELIDLGEEGKAYSTRNRCNSVLSRWIMPRWHATRISDVRAIDVENWLRSLSLARGTKAKIRKTLNLLFNHAIRWDFAARNPISGPVRGSGVRQSEKRERIPEVLSADEFRRLEAALGLRERVLLCLALSLGLRRGELAGLRWHDIDLEQLTITVQRSVVDQIVGRVKTEASQRPLPMDPRIAMLLTDWRSVSKYVHSQDYVFATDSNRAGHKRGTLYNRVGVVKGQVERQKVLCLSLRGRFWCCFWFWLIRPRLTFRISRWRFGSTNHLSGHQLPTMIRCSDSPTFSGRQDAQSAQR